MIQKLDATLFDWITWRSGDVWNDFHIPCRSWALIANRDILNKYAIGWCYGENLICRPKENHIAVMFSKNDKTFWFHLRSEEFERIFKND
jgi:hypothetical protein